MVDSTNLPEVDINQIATDLNGKMDRDCLNASDTGNIQMAKASMPSNRYIGLTLGASGTTYTAPADGYFCIVGLDSIGNVTNYGFVLRRGDRFGITSKIWNTATTTGWITGVLPVNKGDVVYLYHNMQSSDTRFRFYYAQGSESEAS